MEAKGGRTGRGDALRSLTLELEFEEAGRLVMSFEGVAGVELVFVLRRLEGVGAEKDCSKGLGSRSKSERPRGGGRRSGGGLAEWLAVDMTLLESVSGCGLMTEGIKQRHQFPFFLNNLIHRRSLYLLHHHIPRDIIHRWLRFSISCMMSIDVRGV